MDQDSRAAEVLASVRRHRAEADAAERGKLEDAIVWAGLHVVEEDDWCGRWEQVPVTLSGEGAPLISHYCVAEFAAALGVRTESGRMYLTDAVELAYRLPLLLEQVRAGKVPVYKARRIAQYTTDLPSAGAAYVDQRVSISAGRVSIAAAERLVAEARALFDPAAAAEIAKRAAEERHVFINTRQVSFDGNSALDATLDLVDALDLDQTLNLMAAQIQAQYPDLTWDACRAKALGALARGETFVPQVAAVAPRDRTLNLVVHLTASPDGTTLDPSCFLENGKKLLVLDQIKAWCTEATRVTVRPVIDLHENLSVTGYQIPERIAERVKLRDRRCVFPHCERLALACDDDHTTPYDPNGPPGQTATDRLAPLCRHHHQLKTHAGWSYFALEPGVYHWRSPHGLTYLTNPTGTLELTPLPIPVT